MAKDPYRYFRVEARELVDDLTRGALEVAKGGSRTSVVAKLLRLAHTLKGAAQVVKQTGIAELAHSIEGILAPYREGEGPVPGEEAGKAVRLLDQIAVRLKALDTSGEKERIGGVHEVPSEEALATVRVDIEEVEALLAGLTEANIAVNALQNETRAVKQTVEMARALAGQLNSRSGAANGSAALKVGLLAEQLLGSLVRLERSLVMGIERTERELAQAQERVGRLRLLAVDTIFPTLERAARDAAGVLGKPVELSLTGGDIRLDANVLVVLRDVTLHLVRNAIAHGIENEAARTAAGKPTCGSIELRVERRGNRVHLICRDDGGGVDVAAIRRAAVKKGAISPEAAESLGLNEAIDLILSGGMSTTGTVTGISGRGIGLDIVRDAVAVLKGTVSIVTTPGRGTTVEISVPASLTSVAALLVESTGVNAFIPLGSVREARRIDEREIARSGIHESLAYQGRPVPFLSLTEALGKRRAGNKPGERRSAVVVASGAGQAAVEVEKLLGIHSALVHSLPRSAAVEPVVAGACLDAEGNPLLMLDPAALVEAAQRGPSAQSQAPPPSRLPILIIDDSLTTRMVEQNILELAGYPVESATSGEQALEMARTRRYGLFLVDIEMPGMDGFQFIARAREDRKLRDIPCVLVTSRSSAEDRHRGEEAGARAFIAKSEFHQGQFLETIARLRE